ncbi:MAG: leucyl aminopeptidase family protein [Acetobacteraceae bacterium]|nr:leucyl aminopeptidase family protein [Acetobacteraceae bacterium]
MRAVRPTGLDLVLAELPAAAGQFARAAGFRAAAQELLLFPGPDGLGGALLGLGEDRRHTAFGSVAFRLPEGTTWRLEPGDYDPEAATLGYCLGAYGYTAFKAASRAPAQIAPPDAAEPALVAARATFMVRDLINTPANVLGPSELADVTVQLGAKHGATVSRVEGETLTREYPAVAAVGQGSARPAEVASFAWKSNRAGPDAPLIGLCGKGVCFDTGGYDLKPSAGMLRMKKDMGGAAVALGLARMIMERDLPVRLAVWIGCVENSVSGTAMRPLDVIRTRRGLTVEIGNTDAEGRLVLCDLLAAAADQAPSVLLDFSTLTGAARVALGPDVPALFSNDDEFADELIRAGIEVDDPLWRLPLWPAYDCWLDSKVADLNNVSAKPFAGAIVAALFLGRFVQPETIWAHLDLYAWNDQTSPARSEGGEAQAMRAAYAAIESRFGGKGERNSQVT